MSVHTVQNVHNDIISSKILRPTTGDTRIPDDLKQSGVYCIATNVKSAINSFPLTRFIP